MQIMTLYVQNVHRWLTHVCSCLWKSNSIVNSFIQ